MSASEDRLEELIAAAVSDRLSPGEAVELDRLRQRHPRIDEEIAALREVAARVADAGLTWTPVEATAALRERVLSRLPAGSPPHREAADVPRRTRAARWAPLTAACLAVMLAVGVGIPALRALPPAGPPGALGAVEVVGVTLSEPGLRVDAAIIAHTWGTEAVLDVTGLAVGETYSVVVIGEDGTEFSAGEMLGSTVSIHCRLNAAVLREDAARLEIRDAREEVVAAAPLPEV